MSATAEGEPQVVVIRPRKIRRVCWVLAPLVVIFFVVLSTLLTGSLGGTSMGVFRSGDQIAMIILGFLAAGAILIFTRPKVVADVHHIQVQNVFDRMLLVRRLDRHHRQRLVVLEVEADPRVAPLEGDPPDDFPGQVVAAEHVLHVDVVLVGDDLGTGEDQNRPGRQESQDDHRDLVTGAEDTHGPAAKVSRQQCREYDEKDHDERCQHPAHPPDPAGTEDDDLGLVTGAHPSESATRGTNGSKGQAVRPAAPTPPTWPGRPGYSRAAWMSVTRMARAPCS